MNFQRKKNLCLFLLILLVVLAFFPLVILRKKQPEGEYITVAEVQALSRLLARVREDYAGEQISEEEKLAGEALEELCGAWPEGDLTYGQFKAWCEKAGMEWPGEEFDAGYRDDFFLLREDWYRVFNEALPAIDPQGRVKRQELLILGDFSSVTDVEGGAIGETQLFSDEGLWENHLPQGSELIQQKAVFLTFGGGLWGLVERLEEGGLQNVWLMENREGRLRYFYENYEIAAVLGDTDAEGLREGELSMVADLSFRQGGLARVEEKTERISGEVLALSSTHVEIRGQGVFALSESIQYYRLYDRLQTADRSGVRIGYNFADFVLEDGQVEACLMVRDEEMEYVRVLLKTSGFGGYYHESLSISCDVDMALTAGEETTLLPAGEALSLTADSPYFTGNNRLFLEPSALTSKTFLPGLERANGNQGYRGSFEVEAREEGLVVINRLLLEEYLYSVVPSEMPAYYPAEALAAQAVCARTYAYKKMLSSPLASYGAHLDDSSAYQVYNNISENTSTTKAVKETKGQLLYYGEELADAYYYSTSGGYGTDDAIWNSEEEHVIAYLSAKEMTLEASANDPAALQDETVF